MTIFTSVNNFYLAKARVLAKSVKKYIPGATFILILSDKIPLGFLHENEPFDEVITIDNLSIPVENLNMWIYTHTVVELCTAVKGQALYKLLEKYEKVVYIDPDIVVFNDMHILDNLLEQYDIIFTPHLTFPEKDDKDILNNEICSLQHGVYNFGFFAVKANENGKSYAKWYRDRLLKYCVDDIPNGLFTDQRWGDIAPAFFDNIYIWKNPGANVSTWNLSHRHVTKKDNVYYVNATPLLFYHFSGFDSGAQLGMLDIYSDGNQVLYELRNWYIEEINKNGQKECEKIICFYNMYLDGTVVNKEERILLRNSADLQDHFFKTNPYNKEGNSYYSWLINKKKILKNPVLLKQDILINNISYNISLNNDKTNILILLHQWGDKAGTSIHVSDIIKELKIKYNFHILIPYNGVYKLFSYWETGEESMEIFSQVSQNYINRFVNFNYLNMLKRIIDVYNIDIIHIHHMLGHFFDIIDLLKSKNIKLIISLHDLYAFCPRINKINYNIVYCGYPDKDECNSCLKSYNIRIFGITEEKDISEWRKYWLSLFSYAEKIIAPSKNTREEILIRYKNISIDVIEHGIDINGQKEALNIDKDKEFNVAFIGTITEIKGKKIIEELIKYSKNFNDNIFYHLFGRFYSLFAPFYGNSIILNNNYKNFIMHGEYDRNNLQKLFVDNNIKLVCIFSITPESFCYTLTESIANNIPVLAIDEGAVGQRIKENNWGWLLKNGTKVSEIYNVIKNIFNKKDEYKRISEIISASRIKSVKDMNSDYDKVYSLFKFNKIRIASINKIKYFIKENYNNTERKNKHLFLKKIKKVIKSYKDNGIKYTIKLIIKYFLNKLRYIFQERI
jgi:hypothetical protein